jgi:hypothetical protein
VPSVISPDDVTYQLILDDGVNQLIVPIISVTLRRAYDNILAQATEDISVNFPSPFYDLITPYIGGTIRLNKVANGITKPLVSQVLLSVSDDGANANLTGGSLGKAGNASLELSGIYYERIINSALAIRLAPNFDVRYGSKVTVDGLTVDVKSSVVYISAKNQFMEIS